VTALVARVQEHYLDHFRAFLEVMGERWPSGGAEVIFEIPQPTGLFRRLYRVDFVTKDDGELIVRELQPDTILTFDAFSCELRGLAVAFEQLVWDNVEFHHDATNLDDGRLKRWFDYWFDPEDARFHPDAQIGQFIHSMYAEPEHLSVDLGTAAADAFWDLLDLLAASGASWVRVSSSREAPFG
jgi:hypothetical protein